MSSLNPNTSISISLFTQSNRLSFSVQNLKTETIEYIFHIFSTAKSKTGGSLVILWGNLAPVLWRSTAITYSPPASSPLITDDAFQIPTKLLDSLADTKVMQFLTSVNGRLFDMTQIGDAFYEKMDTRSARLNPEQLRTPQDATAPFYHVRSIRS